MMRHVMHVLVLTQSDGSRLGDIGLATWFQEMRQATEKSADVGELPVSNWEQLDISRIQEEDIWKIMPTIERADAIIFLTYTDPLPTNLPGFLKSVGAHATKPYRLPGYMLGFVFIDKENIDPEKSLYFAELRAIANRLQMDRSPGMVRIEKSLTRDHERFARDLVLLLLNKERADTMLEPS